VKGVIADGVVTDSEVVALGEWMQGHKEATMTWPVDVLSSRLRRILDDGVVGEEERAELAELLQQVTGSRPDGTSAMRGATRLPLTDPPPFIEYTGHLFALTGKFVFGTRAACERAIRREGGECCDTPTGKVHYLVIGTLASADWAHSSYGRKIERAVELAREGALIAIVSEEHWSSTLT
jgi:NAD-dependent DNA ligase